MRIPGSGPAGATCTCPAAECCRHVLAAILFVQSDAEASAGATQELSESPGERDALAALLAISRDDLERRCGKAAIARATKLLRELEVTVEDSPTPRVRCSDWECHFPAGADLAAAVCSGPTNRRRERLALSVLAMQRRHGIEPPPERERAALAAPRGTARSRPAVLDGVATLLDELVAMGISHLSASIAQRLRTLSLSASAVRLPRLSLGLREAADEIELLLVRSARADEARLYGVFARLHALLTALLAGDPPSPELVGTFRSRYEATRELVLTGLGAYRWRSRSGYRGLTVVLLDESTGSWVSWSDSRPDGVDPAFEPHRRYLESPPWQGAGTPASTSRHRLRLTGARINEQGRLSSTRGCRAADLGSTDPRAVAWGEHRFDDWSALRARAARTLPLGLAVADAQTSLVVVEPARWGRATFDEVSQTLVVPLLDGSGDAVPLRVPYSPVNEGALRRLETIAAAPAAVWAVCARLRLHRDGVALYPLSLLLTRPDARGESIVNLTLDPLPRSGRLAGWLQRALARSNSRADDDGEEASPPPRWPPPTEAELARLEEGLQRVAESGRRAFDDDLRDRLREHAQRLGGHGLTVLAASVASVAEGAVDGARLLELRYLCDLHRQAAVRSAVESPSAGAPLG